MFCRHCERNQACRPRGLCWTCYYTPRIRKKYPSTSKFARRGPGAVFRLGSPPTAPTQAIPGSPEKIAVLAQRVPVVRRRLDVGRPGADLERLEPVAQAQAGGGLDGGEPPAQAVGGGIVGRGGLGRTARRVR